MRKIVYLGIILTVSLLCLAMQVFGFNEETVVSGEYEYIILENDTAEITQYNGMDLLLNVPDKIDGLYVTSIGAEAFNLCNAYEIIIPNSVVKIGNNCFAGANVRKIALPDSLRSIGSGAFYGCKYLSEITLPKELTFLGEGAFSGCWSLKELMIPAGVKEIGLDTFQDCKVLEKITFCEGIEADYGLYDCYALKFIDIPVSMKTIGCLRYINDKRVHIIRYAGTQEQWNKIEKTYKLESYIESGNIKVHYLSHKTEQKPEEFISCDKDGYTPGIYCYDCLEWVDGHKKIETSISHIYEHDVDYDKDDDVYAACYRCVRCNDYYYKYIYPINDYQLSPEKVNYTGYNIKPAVSATDSRGNKVDVYSVKCDKEIKNPGKYDIDVVFYQEKNDSATLILQVAPASPKPTATQTENSITLSWEKAVGATGYRVYSYNPTTKKYTKIASIKDTTYTVQNLNSGTKYYYAVKAYTKDEGTIWGDMSEVLTTATKPAKSTLTVKSASKGKAILSWTNVSGETGFQVYYKDSKDGTYKKYKTYSGNTVKATASSLTSGKTYYFKVRAYKKADGKTIYGSFSSAKSVKIK